MQDNTDMFAQMKSHDIHTRRRTAQAHETFEITL